MYHFRGLTSSIKGGDIADLTTFSSCISEPISSFSHVQFDTLRLSAALAFHQDLCKAFPSCKCVYCLRTEVVKETQLGLPARMIHWTFLPSSGWRSHFFSLLFWNMLQCCGFTDCFRFLPPPETSSKNSWSLTGPGVLATWRWVDFLSDPDGSFPYFIPLVGSLLSEGLKVHMVPISHMLKFMEGLFGLFSQSGGWRNACGSVYLVRVQLNI